MKLRIKDNSIRLRLQKSEVAALAATGRVEAYMLLGLTDQWDRISYAVEHAPHYSEIRAERIGLEIRITVPTSEIHDWASGEIVGVYGAQKVFGEKVLNIVVEKDFACLDRSDAENADTYDHPNASAC